MANRSVKTPDEPVIIRAGFLITGSIIDAAPRPHRADDAAEGGHAEIANLLTGRGADASLKDKAGKRAADLTVLTSLRERLTRP